MKIWIRIGWISVPSDRESQHVSSHGFMQTLCLNVHVFPTKNCGFSNWAYLWPTHASASVHDWSQPRLWVNLYLFCDVTHLLKHAIVCRRNISERGGMQSCFLHRGLTNNGDHLRTVGGSLCNSLLRRELGCWKNSQEKGKRKKYKE